MSLMLLSKLRRFCLSTYVRACVRACVCVCVCVCVLPLLQAVVTDHSDDELPGDVVPDPSSQRRAADRELSQTSAAVASVSVPIQTYNKGVESQSSGVQSHVFHAAQFGATNTPATATSLAPRTQRTEREREATKHKTSSRPAATAHTQRRREGAEPTSSAASAAGVAEGSAGSVTKRSGSVTERGGARPGLGLTRSSSNRQRVTSGQSTAVSGPGGTAEQAGLLFEGDIMLSAAEAQEVLHTGGRKRRRRKVTYSKKKRWTLPIPYLFDQTPQYRLSKRCFASSPLCI